MINQFLGIVLTSIAKGTLKIEGFLHAGRLYFNCRYLRDLGVQIDEEADGSIIVHSKGIEGLTARSYLDLWKLRYDNHLLAGLSQFPFKIKMIGDDPYQNDQ